MGTPSEQQLSRGDDVFAAFHEYPWQNDLAFLKGLIALLGGVEKLLPDPSHLDMAIHARVFYYRKIRSVDIDFSTYKQWAEGRPGPDAGPDQTVLSGLYWAREQIASLHGPPPPNMVHAVAAIAQRYVPPLPPAAAATAAPPSGLVWQQAAPTHQLHVSRPESSAGRSAPYPAHFAELIAAVQAGKPIPGVREIPDTIIRDPTIKPIGKMAAPKKPWERDVANDGGEPFRLETAVSQDFPPLDDDETQPESNQAEK